MFNKCVHSRFYKTVPTSTRGQSWLPLKSLLPPSMTRLLSNATQMLWEEEVETSGSSYSQWTDRAKSFGGGRKAIIWFRQLVLQLWIHFGKNARACGIYRGVEGRLFSLFLLFDCWKWQDFVKMLNTKLTLSWFELTNILSLVGRVFFSWVSVFFSLDLSNLLTSSKSGLSPISAEALQAREKNYDSNSTPACFKTSFAKSAESHMREKRFDRVLIPV